MRELSQQIIQNWKTQVSPKIEPLFTVVWLGGISIAAFSLWGFTEIAENVLEKETAAIDKAILTAIHSFQTPLLDQIVVGVTFLGDPLVLSVLSAIFAIFLLWQRRWTTAVCLAIVVAGGVGLNFFLKDLFARNRPDLWERVLDVRYYSFPSGHAMISLIVYGFVGYWVASRYPAWRYLVASAVVFLVIAIGISRLYLGVHWPTDIVAGYAAGLVWLIACILSLEIAKKLYARSGK